MAEIPSTSTKVWTWTGESWAELMQQAMASQMAADAKAGCMHEFGLGGECLKCHAVEMLILPKGKLASIEAELDVARNLVATLSQRPTQEAYETLQREQRERNKLLADMTSLAADMCKRGVDPVRDCWLAPQRAADAPTKAGIPARAVRDAIAGWKGTYPPFDSECAKPGIPARALRFGV